MGISTQPSARLSGSSGAPRTGSPRGKYRGGGRFFVVKAETARRGQGEGGGRLLYGSSFLVPVDVDPASGDARRSASTPMSPAARFPSPPAVRPTMRSTDGQPGLCRPGEQPGLDRRPPLQAERLDLARRRRSRAVASAPRASSQAGVPWLPGVMRQPPPPAAPGRSPPPLLCTPVAPVPGRCWRHRRRRRSCWSWWTWRQLHCWHLRRRRRPWQHRLRRRHRRLPPVPAPLVASPPAPLVAFALALLVALPPPPLVGSPPDPTALLGVAAAHRWSGRRRCHRRLMPPPSPLVPVPPRPPPSPPVPLLRHRRPRAVSLVPPPPGTQAPAWHSAARRDAAAAGHRATHGRSSGKARTRREPALPPAIRTRPSLSSAVAWSLTITSSAGPSAQVSLAGS